MQYTLSPLASWIGEIAIQITVYVQFATHPWFAMHPSIFSNSFHMWLYLPAILNKVLPTGGRSRSWWKFYINCRTPLLHTPSAWQIRHIWYIQTNYNYCYTKLVLCSKDCYAFSPQHFRCWEYKAELYMFQSGFDICGWKYSVWNTSCRPLGSLCLFQTHSHITK